MEKYNKSKYINLAEKIAEQFKGHSPVEAIALGGSQTSGLIDNHSDLDTLLSLEGYDPQKTLMLQ